MHKRFVRDLVCLAVFIAVLKPAWAQNEDRVPDKPAALTLAEVSAKALARHPALEPYTWEIKARDAAVTQAGRLPNPTVGLEVEDVAGSGGYGGTRQAQTTFTLSQPVELGGKRALRLGAAQAARSQAELELAFQRQELLFQVRTAFTTVLVAQERHRLQAEGFKLAQDVAGTVAARVDAGKVSPVELDRAQAAVTVARKNLDLAVQDLQGARQHLAWISGSTAGDSLTVKGDLDALGTVPGWTESIALLLGNSAVRAIQADLVRSSEEAKLARKSRLPDVTLSAGYRHFSAGEDHAMLFGASVPLPIFQRQRGVEAEAAARLEKTRAEELALKHRLQGELLGHLAVLERTLIEARSYSAQLLPSARHILSQTREGYAGGKFGYLELLDSQRTLLGLQLEYLDSLQRHHHARAEVARLLGSRFSEF